MLGNEIKPVLINNKDYSILVMCRGIEKWAPLNLETYLKDTTYVKLK